MRLLGIDYGTKKVGLALSDESGKMAFPHAVIPNDSTLLETIVDVVTDKEVAEIVIGHSLNLAGEANPVQSDIESFMGDLTLRVPVPIQLEPEQLTSRQAAAVTGKNDQIDAAAAAIILDSFITKRSNMNQPPATPEPEATEDTDTISYDDFLKVDIRLGTITAVDVVEDADRLLKLTVDLGEDTPRQIVSGIREFYEDEQALVGQQCPFIVNLPVRKIKGLESQGMILAADADGVFAAFHPSNELPPGTRLH